LARLGDHEPVEQLIKALAVASPEYVRAKGSLHVDLAQALTQPPRRTTLGSTSVWLAILPGSYPAALSPRHLVDASVAGIAPATSAARLSPAPQP
jgi:hypothetical protein